MPLVITSATSTVTVALTQPQATIAAAVTQRYDADRRDAQWKRIEWALDLMLANEGQGRSDTISGAALKRFLQDTTLHPDDRLVVGQALETQREHLRADIEAFEAMTDEAYDASAGEQDGHHEADVGH